MQVYVPSTFWITILDAFYQSLVCFFVPYFVSRLSAAHDLFLRRHWFERCVVSQAFAGSDVAELSFGSPINASALLIILLQQVMESHTLVRGAAHTFVVFACLCLRSL